MVYLTGTDVMSSKDLMEFVKGARAENKARQEKSMAEGGQKPFLKLEAGETVLTLQPTIPIVRKNSFGQEQYGFEVEHEKVLKLWTLSKNNPIAIKIVDKLLKAPCKITVIRTGEGKATRYDLKEK